MADAIVIAGTTASGKTALAIAVAARVHGAVISFDSRQVYRGMDIGTAKPAPAERAGVPHYGFDLVDPRERFNAGRFAQHAHEWLQEIRAAGRTPVLAGGTGFFLRALTHPMFDEPALDAERKEGLKRYLADWDTSRLTRWAETLDAAAAARVQDRQRLARVIETALLTGHTLSWWHRQAPVRPPSIDPLVFVLDLPRDVLYERINARVDAMIARGLVEEVQSLLARGFTERDPGMNAVGYAEMIPYLRGEYDLAGAIDAIKRSTRRYARRQITWLRHQLPADAVHLDALQPVNVLAEHIARRWSHAARAGVQE
jgi:tRNA dimethylallyltransferase